jgi:hypothetical protein
MSKSEHGRQKFGIGILYITTLFFAVRLNSEELPYLLREIENATVS